MTGRTINLTPARRRGLATLAHWHGGDAVVSNVTDVRRGFVYWQTARWLIDEGLAEVDGVASQGGGVYYLKLTRAGVAACEHEGLL